MKCERSPLAELFIGTGEVVGRGSSAPTIPAAVSAIAGGRDPRSATRETTAAVTMPDPAIPEIVLSRGVNLYLSS